MNHKEIRQVIRVLKKQEAKPIKKEYSGKSAFDGSLWYQLKCPSCGEIITMMNHGISLGQLSEHTNFCSRCGQRLDWKNPNETE